MSTHSEEPARQLPANPDLRHLKDQAKDLLKAGQAQSLAKAQFQIAKRYGFASWAKLKALVESLQLAGQLKLAIDANDLALVKRLMTRHPELHRAPLGYGKNGPLTWVAECRVPRVPPNETRLAMARWMIENGSDIHQGGDGPLMRAALDDMKLPMTELLVAHGADVNAVWGGTYPIILAPLEAFAPGPCSGCSTTAPTCTWPIATRSRCSHVSIREGPRRKTRASRSSARPASRCRILR